jgi:hypothetical protein
VSQRIAQASAWHFANGMSWEELANKRINRLGRPDEPYFNRAELQAAVQLASIAERAAKETTKEKETTGSPGALSQR